MTEQYVTLLDSGFLPWLICLKESLERHDDDHVLWVVAMDRELPGHLERLQLGKVRCIPVDALEARFPDLGRVRPGRGRAEYCWTVTPFTFEAVWAERPGARVTYIDADVALLAPPGPLFRGFDASGASVQITDHGHDPRWADKHIAACGRYCVQFLTVRPTDSGKAILRWWQERCIEWCYNRREPGRYGDQKYLDDWPQRFGTAVHVLEDFRLTQAPWNRDHCRSVDPILYHYQGFRPIGRGQVMLWYGFPVHDPTVWDRIYRLYLATFAAAQRRLAAAGIAIPVARYHPLKLLKARWWHAPRGYSRIVPFGTGT